MIFFERLKDETQDAQAGMFAAPIIGRTLAGDATVEDYVAFLAQAFQHVKHTVPLLMAMGSRLSDEQEWLREAVAEYIEEETGHQEWVLNDIAACGYDKEKARRAAPNLATELMVAYAWDTVQRGNPLGFFGMVHVLEGTSISTADRIADAVQASCGLPDSAFSYLRSHGSLDQRHVKFFEGLMNRLKDGESEAVIVHKAQVFYRLYGDVFRGLDAAQARLLK